MPYTASTGPDSANSSTEEEDADRSGQRERAEPEWDAGQ